MKTIDIVVRDKIAHASRDALYICGNSDFVVAFDFDEEWAEYTTKTARFTWNGQYEDVIFDGNECPVPIISDAHSFKVGVFAGNLRTTTPAYVPAKKSILCDGGVPADPPPDVYAQIMEKLNEMDSANDAAQLAALVETDMLPAVHDTSGAILTDENGNIILRY